MTSSLVLPEPRYLAVNPSLEDSPLLFLTAEEAVDGWETLGFGFVDGGLGFFDPSVADGGSSADQVGLFWAEPTGIEDLWTVHMGHGFDTDTPPVNGSFYLELSAQSRPGTY